MPGHDVRVAPRQRQILALLNREGWSVARIAEHLGIQANSARAAVGVLRQRLGGGTRWEVVARARRLGLVPASGRGLLQAPTRRRIDPGLQLRLNDRRLLQLMNRDLRAQDIASRLGVPTPTIVSRMYSLGKKLGGGTRLEVVERARAAGLITVPARGALLRKGCDPSRADVTERERVILELVANGVRNPEIAKKLRVSGVHSVVSRLRMKFGATSRYDLVDRARRQGFLPPVGVGEGLQPIQLSALQVRVLLLVREHLTPSQIGRRLRRPVSSVTSVLMQVKRRLNAPSNRVALERAIELRLVPTTLRSDALHPLTERECEILEGLFLGYSQREIGEQLGISKGVVGSRVAMLKSKLRTPSIEELLDEVERLDLYHPRGERVDRVPRTVLAKRNPARYGAKAIPPRTQDVLEMICRYPTLALVDVAKKLGMARGTLMMHLTHLRRRLDVERTEELPARAFQLRLVRYATRPVRRARQT